MVIFQTGHVLVEIGGRNRTLSIGLHQSKSAVIVDSECAPEYSSEGGAKKAGTISQKVYDRMIRIIWKLILPYLRFYSCNQVRVLYMSWHISCGVMRKIVPWSYHYFSRNTTHGFTKYELGAHNLFVKQGPRLSNTYLRSWDSKYHLHIIYVSDTVLGVLLPAVWNTSCKSNLNYQVILTKAHCT